MKRRVLILSVVLAAGVASSLLWMLWSRSPVQHQRLHDGTVLTVEAVTFGSNHCYGQGVKIASLLPDRLRPLLGGSPWSYTLTTKPNSVVLWVSRRNPKTGAPLPTDSRAGWFSITDEHGCEFAYGSGANDGQGAARVVAAPFEELPRRSRVFTVNFWLDGADQAVSIPIRNPFPRDFPEWQPEPLPAARTNGPFVFTLRGVELEEGGSRWFPGYRPVFDVTKNGQPNREWNGPGWHYSDSSGQLETRFLCTNSPAWKLHASFERKSTAAFRAEEIWGLPEFTVPAPGETVSLGQRHSWPGLEVQLLELRHLRAATNVASTTRPGVLPTAASAAQKTEASSSLAPGLLVSRATPLATRVRPEPEGGLHLALRVKETLSRGTGQPVILIRGRDDKGRSFPSSFNNRSGSFPIEARLAIPEEARSFTLEIIVHRTFDMEFLVADYRRPPPQESGNR